MSIPQDPEIPTPLPDENPPIDTPAEVPQPTEPEIRAPGSEEVPMDAPREDPEMGSA